MDVKWNNSKISYKNVEYLNSYQKKKNQFEKKEEAVEFYLGHVKLEVTQDIQAL